MKETELIKLLKDHLNLARDKMKLFADQKRSPRQFDIGDFVLLKLQPYKQSCLKNSMPQKLAPKFYGPYQVIERTEEVSYKLLLPPETKIHNVFYVSQLKKYHGQLPMICSEVTKFWEDSVRQPVKLLGHQMVKKNN